MIYHINKKIIETVLKREFKLDDFNLKLNTWNNIFLANLLKYYEEQVDNLPEENEEDISVDELKIHYEQIVRIFYLLVIKWNIEESENLKRIFRYLFEKDRHMKPEYLIEIYNSLIKDINPCLRKDNPIKRESIDIFVGKYNNEKMKNKLDNIEIHIDMYGKIIIIKF